MKDNLLRARLYGLVAVAGAAYTGVMATILGCWWRYRVTPLHPEDSLFAVLVGVVWLVVALVGMFTDKKAAAPVGTPDLGMDRFQGLSESNRLLVQEFIMQNDLILQRLKAAAAAPEGGTDDARP